MQDFLQEKQVSAEQIYGKLNISTYKGMDIEQFGTFVKSINYIISQEEIIDMFSLLDKNNSKTIEISEFRTIIGY